MTTRTATHALPLSQAELGSALRFVAVGTSGTALQVALFALAQLVLSTTAANLSAFAVSTVITNLVHRRVTYGVRRARGAGLDSVVAFGTTLIGLALSTVLTNCVEGFGTAWQLPMIVVGTAIGGALRYLLMKWWLARRAYVAA